MAWFKRDKKAIQTPVDEERTVRTEGLFTKCEDCKSVIWKKDLEASFFVCPKCQYHFRITARQRLEVLFDDGNYEEFDAELRSSDPLEFVDKKAYRSRLDSAVRSTGSNEAVVNARGTLNGVPTICSAMEYRFIGGSMGSVVGEKITRAVELALEENTPLIIVSASGGARMMESFLSLMQMAKISAALARLHKARLPYVSILTDPTTGGVTASYAMLGDLNIAEPKALIGFAGPRVIEQTIRQKLPEGFQRSEFLLEHGMLDAVVNRREHRAFIYDWFDFMGVV
ncbi:MAG: acetyl-CoA carboxylase carboxyltransferase subunit beta [Acidobacteriota bacterium]|nr:MAG: acetyl-CoA carboxylase carboxyltransferase subunit beta [Acidobacteriota bacterium]